MDAETLPDPVPMLRHNTLIAIAGTVAEQYDKFTGWLMAALAAALALIVSNLDKPAFALGSATVKQAILLFLGAFAFHTLQRIIGALIASAAAGSKANQVPLLTPEQAVRLLEGIERAYFPPFSWLVGYTFQRLRAGDIEHVGTVILRMALCLSVLVIVQICFALGAVWVVGRSL